MKVSELGEFRLIDLLSEIVSQRERDQQIVVGIGDDAAAWRSGDSTLLATTDTLVQGVHFTAGNTWGELGWKAMAINLSDIAAMGGIPQYALVSLSLPGDTEVDDVTQLYHGLAEAANQFKTAVVGGNISRAPVVVVTITLIGQAQTYGILTRSAAVPGDMIAVTGYLGSSAAGLRMLVHHLQFDPETVAFLRKAHLKPQPRIAEGQLLVRKGVQAAIDISDGLIADLGHVCKASGVGAMVKVNQVPLHPLVRAAFPWESLSFALAGGEDYELLFTAGREVIDSVKEEADCPITVIGEMREKEGVTLIDKEGKSFPFKEKGWEHFASPPVF
ncbi:MAG TPA: thiamine-phosphate kinase [Dehalococcoidia bacterium]|nr:thiamine-phosphate kinase [Dehalococcoidia bacterium]